MEFQFSEVPKHNCVFGRDARLLVGAIVVDAKFYSITIATPLNDILNYPSNVFLCCMNKHSKSQGCL